MFDSLFGGGQYALKTLLFFIVVFGLLALALWLMKRFGGERLRNVVARGRQPRLAVLEAAAVDGRRRLVLIRRDNVEHLLMIGGPTDVVVETNVLRAAVAPREAAAPRPLPAGDTLPRAVPLGEGSTWPLQPEPAHRIEPLPRGEPLPRAEPPPRPQRPPAPVAEEPAAWPAEPELPPSPAPARERRSRSDPLAGLAEELSRTPAPPEPDRAEPPPRPAPRRLRPQIPAPSPPFSGGAKFTSPADQNLAEMAQRLEAALRRPTAKTEAPRPPQPEPQQPEPEAIENIETSAPPPPEPAAAPVEQAQPAGSESRAGRTENKPSQQKSLYDSLEQEMANLLGRPTK
jgi:flagellar protein FliO/FliZ